MRKEAFPRTDRPRTVITTDPELDDLNSMIRLLTHANEIDLRGLVYAGSACHWAGDPARGIAPHRWPAPGETLHIDTAIDAYARVEETLRVHDPRFPTAAHLRSLVRTGNVAAAGEMDEVTPGSALIADLLRETALTPDGPAGIGALAASAVGDAPADAARPLFVQAWGGTSTIARALRSVEEELGTRPDWPVLKQRVLDRLVISSFGEQDPTLESYIRPAWPGLEHRDVATTAWGCLSRTVLAVRDRGLVGAGWTRRSVSARGPLGAAYRVWGDGRRMAAGFDAEDYFGESGRSEERLRGEGYRIWCPLQEPGSFISEGDTANFTPLVPNGLRSWEDAAFGGWGGRQTPDPDHPDTLTSGTVLARPGAPALARGGLVVDHAPGGPDGPDGPAPPEYHVTRWWRAVQNEFAARLAWSVTPRYEDANHPPLVLVAGAPATAEGGLARAVRPGEVVTLTATATDPDGDDVLLRWWAYPEAGASPCPVAPRLRDDGAGTAVVTVPAAAEPGQAIHLIAEGTDTGSPALTRYQRVVLTVA